MSSRNSSMASRERPKLPSPIETSSRRPLPPAAAAPLSEAPPGVLRAGSTSLALLPDAPKAGSLPRGLRPPLPPSAASSAPETAPAPAPAPEWALGEAACPEPPSLSSPPVLPASALLWWPSTLASVPPSLAAAVAPANGPAAAAPAAAASTSEAPAEAPLEGRVEAADGCSGVEPQIAEDVEDTAAAAAASCCACAWWPGGGEEAVVELEEEW
mmetsp:Transcript_40824/g.131313  ORF Transcript_40824/g.131313 Transcript_40824/m.131313 type:complete len:214 (+) Transcript_40824:927-1568(+)